MHNEWPLIFFTLLIQLSVGLSFLLLIINAKIKADTDKFLVQGFMVASLLGVIGLLVSFFHLGSPLNAINAVSGLGSSWLSREILFTSIFIGLIVVASFLAWKGNLKNSIGLGWLAVIFGFLAIYAMAKLYMDTIIPAWNHINTLFTFIGVALILGAYSAAVLFVRGLKNNLDLVKETLKIAFGIVILALVLQVVVLPLYLTALAGGSIFAQTTGQILGNTYATLFMLRWLLVLVGGAVLAAFAWVKLNKAKPAIPVNIIYTAFVCIIVAEVIGRYLFYASAVPITIGV